MDGKRGKSQLDMLPRIEKVTMCRLKKQIKKESV